jgi:hypothetical protein
MFSAYVIATVVWSKWYAHLRFPAPFLLLAAASLALRLVTR